MASASAPCGFAAVRKPAGMSSARAVAIVRRRFGRRARVGHTGTLDPLATGLLVVAVGSATRFMQYLPSGKRYTAVVRFGVRTETDDLEGKVLSEQAVPADLPERLRELLPQLIGAQQQAAPAYSALKHEGKPLYAYARAGKEAPCKVRTVHFEAISLADITASGEAKLDVRCGPGTYMRSLARDLGEKVGCGATLAHLMRTECSGLGLADAQQLEGEGPLPLIEPACLLDLVRVPVSQSARRALLTGAAAAAQAQIAGVAAAVCPQGKLIGAVRSEREDDRYFSLLDASEGAGLGPPGRVLHPERILSAD